MEFAWCEFVRGKDGNTFMKTVNRIKLFPQGTGGQVKFNWDEADGRWTYNSSSNQMFIEFKSGLSKHAAKRRHALQERDDGSFQLIPWGNVTVSYTHLTLPPILLV